MPSKSVSVPEGATLSATLASLPLRLFDTALERLDDVLDRARASRLGDIPTAAVLLSPALVILGLFGILPLFAAFYMSLFSREAFIGAGNYIRALGDPGSGFYQSLVVTVYYTVGTVPPALVVSFLIAYMLFRVAWGRGLFRTLYFLPYVTSAVAAATVWRALFNPQYGLVNAALAYLGMDPGEWPQWLLEPRGLFYYLSGGHLPPTSGPSVALLVVILFDIWHSSGFMIVVFLAGLSAIPRELIEAATMDGANGRQTVTRVILPLLSPTVFFLLVVSVIRSFQAFNSIYTLTGDNAARLQYTTRNLTMLIYQSFYEQQDLGFGAASAVLLCLAIVALTVVQWRYLGRRVHYE